MPDGLPEAELRELLRSTNEQLADRFTEFHARFAGEAAAVPEIEMFVEQLGLGQDNPRSANETEFYGEGARAFLEVLQQHPAFRGEAPSPVGLPVVGDLFPT